jgi:hypothetical protein
MLHASLLQLLEMILGMRAGIEGLSSWWQQETGSGHSAWALTFHVRHPHVCTV